MCELCVSNALKFSFLSEFLDEARDFPQILTSLEENWGEHAKIAEDICIANGSGACHGASCRKSNGVRYLPLKAVGMIFSGLEDLNVFKFRGIIQGPNCPCAPKSLKSNR